eukprot:gnl/MRDRNA2_/MRDRNA2_35203_c0_seq1.p1 gnl/MRDRNA2_/MRDRNA2_35203_c0~~gnl/MRDRNA2_/MRDRNA2_35203_c0_seq1.p1  ORF type:complete len:135 (+),score=30.90 gnl/MRDRNA2_/MRDRNA2_35203_c0_seq1:47-406(+)
MQHAVQHTADTQFTADAHWHMNSADAQMLSSPMACGTPMAQTGYASSSPMACQPGVSPMHCQQSPLHCQQPAAVPPMPAMQPVHQDHFAYQWLAGESASAAPMDLAAQLSAVAQTLYED